MREMIISFEQSDWATGLATQMNEAIKSLDKSQRYFAFKDKHWVVKYTPDNMRFLQKVFLQWKAEHDQGEDFDIVTWLKQFDAVPYEKLLSLWDLPKAEKQRFFKKHISEWNMEWSLDVPNTHSNPITLQEYASLCTNISKS